MILQVVPEVAEVVLLDHEDAQGDDEGQDEEGQGHGQELLPVGPAPPGGLGPRGQALLSVCYRQVGVSMLVSGEIQGSFQVCYEPNVC